MRVGAISARTVSAEGTRLNGGFHLAEDQQAWRLLSAIAAEDKERLEDLCSDRGVFRGPIFARTYCSNPALGRPYVSPAELERAEIRTDRYLAASHGELLSELELKQGMVLVTCSGMNLGRAVFVRPSMEGICASHDLIRIESDSRRVRAGFLYAFLRSRFGHVALRRQIYGGNIKHIEPHHVGSVPVPRIGTALERRIHDLIEESATLLNDYENSVRHATSVLLDAVGLQDVTPVDWRAQGPELGFSVSDATSKSLRALNHSPRAQRLAAEIKKGPWRKLGEICVPGTLKSGGRFKRIDAAPEHSYLLVGQKDIFGVRPEGRWIARVSVGASVLVPPGTVLIAAQGTLGESELYCRTQFIWGRALNNAYSQHFIRAIADEAVMPRGCLYAFLRSEMAFRLLRSVSIGTKLQDFHPTLRYELPVPYPEKDTQHEVHALVVRAYEARDRAVAKEEEAVSLLEKAIEEKAN